ncbi:MAG TPA: hypothetical protein VJH06_02230 [Candidatus Paceibacterota bacterium]
MVKKDSAPKKTPGDLDKKRAEKALLDAEEAALDREEAARLARLPGNQKREKEEEAMASSTPREQTEVQQTPVKTDSAPPSPGVPATAVRSSPEDPGAKIEEVEGFRVGEYIQFNTNTLEPFSDLKPKRIIRLEKDTLVVDENGRENKLSKGSGISNFRTDLFKVIETNRIKYEGIVYATGDKVSSGERRGTIVGFLDSGLALVLWEGEARKKSQPWIHVAYFDLGESGGDKQATPQPAENSAERRVFRVGDWVQRAHSQWAPFDRPAEIIGFTNNNETAKIKGAFDDQETETSLGELEVMARLEKVEFEGATFKLGMEVILSINGEEVKGMIRGFKDEHTAFIHHYLKHPSMGMYPIDSLRIEKELGMDDLKEDLQEHSLSLDDLGQRSIDELERIEGVIHRFKMKIRKDLNSELMKSGSLEELLRKINIIKKERVAKQAEQFRSLKEGMKVDFPDKGTFTLHRISTSSKMGYSENNYEFAAWNGSVYGWTEKSLATEFEKGAKIVETETKTKEVVTPNVVAEKIPADGEKPKEAQREPGANLEIKEMPFDLSGLSERVRTIITSELERWGKFEPRNDSQKRQKEKWIYQLTYHPLEFFMEQMINTQKKLDFIKERYDLAPNDADMSSFITLLEEIKPYIAVVSVLKEREEAMADSTPTEQAEPAHVEETWTDTDEERLNDLKRQLADLIARESEAAVSSQRAAEESPADITPEEKRTIDSLMKLSDMCLDFPLYLDECRQKWQELGGNPQDVEGLYKEGGDRPVIILVKNKNNDFFCISNTTELSWIEEINDQLFELVGRIGPGNKVVELLKVAKAKKQANGNLVVIERGSMRIIL